MARKLTEEEISNRILNSHGNTYQILTHAKTTMSKIEVLHTTCGTIFTPILSDFMGNKKKRKPTGCPKCSHPSRSLSQTEMEIKTMELDDEYRLISEYKNTHTKATFLHLSCKREFEMRPNNFFIKNNRCPFCPRSRGEEAIDNWLSKNEIVFESQFKPGKEEIGSNFISYDFKIEFNNHLILIEFDGRFHFEPFSNNPKHIESFEKRKELDILKNEYAEKSNYALHRIHYKDLENIEILLETLFNDYRKHKE